MSALTAEGSSPPALASPPPSPPQPSARAVSTSKPKEPVDPAARAEREVAAVKLQTHWRARTARQQVKELKAAGAQRLRFSSSSDAKPKPTRPPPTGAITSRMSLLREQLKLRLKTGDLDLVRAVY
eukprot:7357181-Prymnesium_polylepis.1